MSPKLSPEDPASCMIISDLTSNITTLSLPFSRFGRIKIGGRATLIRFPSSTNSGRNSVAVFSPVPLTPLVRAEVEKMGELRYIAALDMEHHLFVEQWHKEYPRASIIGPEGMREKKRDMSEASKTGKVGWIEFLNGKQRTRFQGGEKDGVEEKEGFTVDEEFDKVFDRTYIPGHANKELVFNFRPEKTLITADLMFNLPAVDQYKESDEDAKAGLLTRIFTFFNNTTPERITWQKRFLWYVASSGDRKGFSKSVREVAEWDFDRVVMCHGNVIKTGGKSVFESLFGWHLDLAKKAV